MRLRTSVLVILAAALSAALVAATAPAQAVSTPSVKLSGGPFLVVDVNPNLPGTANWSFTLQRRTSTGTWAKVGSYTTTGTSEVRQLAVGSGTYRVIVAARPGFTSKTSASYTYVPKPIVKWTGGSLLRLDVDPNLAGTAFWNVTLQRNVGGVWSTVGTYPTQGTSETVRALVGSGTYRAVVAKRDRFPAYTSPSYSFSYNPSVTGPYAAPVGVDVTVSNEEATVSTTRYFPAAPAGSAPLVVFMAGFQTSRSGYAGTATWLAQHGFAVITVGLTGGLTPDLSLLAGDADAVIRQARQDPAATVIDDEQVAVLGHSLGGAVAVQAAFNNATTKAVLAIDPVDGTPSMAPETAQSLRIPMGFIGETLDSTSPGGQACAPAAENYTQFYNAATFTRAYEWTIAGASHTSFLDAAPTFDVCQTATTERARVLAATRTLATAFLVRHLRADTRQDAWLTGARIGTAPLDIVTVRSKSAP